GAEDCPRARTAYRRGDLRTERFDIARDRKPSNMHLDDAACTNTRKGPLRRANGALRYPGSLHGRTPLLRTSSRLISFRSS
ncbi:MAG: hypothetical protein ACRENE_23435, partial [Polyangiaceae bacterium]